MLASPIVPGYLNGNIFIEMTFVIYRISNKFLCGKLIRYEMNWRQEVEDGSELYAGSVGRLTELGSSPLVPHSVLPPKPI